ncbi:hypothetical protein QBC33DRAFT_215276 [Phialemonium atrogriseum]|uniref:Uncharacterized protein n=1 Tax=Phialemonium atrogriseum TaxID=1093897 RepID=A0AAJ0C5X1_9PEZI|nr:uncharacterized protein QBC33DRAFT_215276 [Phialemonium atrogriseum]KAK1770750.1 hypothetical protein QBC33DRAFT_215276 [Phialemonium atrogriseum]
MTTPLSLSLSLARASGNLPVIAVKQLTSHSPPLPLPSPTSPLLHPIVNQAENQPSMHRTRVTNLGAPLPRVRSIIIKVRLPTPDWPCGRRKQLIRYSHSRANKEKNLACSELPSWDLRWSAKLCPFLKGASLHEGRGRLGSRVWNTSASLEGAPLATPSVIFLFWSFLLLGLFLFFLVSFINLSLFLAVRLALCHFFLRPPPFLFGRPWAGGLRQTFPLASCRQIGHGTTELWSHRKRPLGLPVPSL